MFLSYLAPTAFYLSVNRMNYVIIRKPGRKNYVAFMYTFIVILQFIQNRENRHCNDMFYHYLGYIKNVAITSDFHGAFTGGVTLAHGRQDLLFA